MSYSETKGGEILNYLVAPEDSKGPKEIIKHRIVRLITDHTVFHSNAAYAHGVSIQNGVSGQRVDVQVGGVAQVKLLSAVSAGDHIVADTEGLGRTGATGETTIGIAQEDGIADQIIAVLIDRTIVTGGKN